MKKELALLCVLGGFQLSAANSCATDCAAVTIHYHERIPYARTSDTDAEGLTATPAALAFSKAGIPFLWQMTPSKRQMMQIVANEGCDCAIGWFKNPEREKFAKFTAPIYQDRPQISLSRADNEKLQNGMKLETLLSAPDLTLEIKDGYSYGGFLDAKIALHKPQIDKTTGESISMLKKIHAKRADYFFIAPEEADYLIESSGLPKKDFKYINHADMPEGEKRYIMCSQKIGDETIKKLNAAIVKYVQKK
ncbi:MAG: transporter substrate-binding domain-containing protein [Burkholderiales bacterium]|nr:transporter substrate-binding domain-containing protein [Burkholderiales bacterium]